MVGKLFKIAVILAIVLTVLPGLAGNTHAEPSQPSPPTESDVWRMIGVDPHKPVSIDEFSNKILNVLASALRFLMVFSIPIAVVGAVIGAIVWGVGVVTQNDRVRKSGVVTMLSVALLPVLAKLAPLLVASLASSFK